MKSSLASPQIDLDKASTFEGDGAKVDSINAGVGPGVAVVACGAPVGGAVLAAGSLIGDAVGVSVGGHFLTDLPLLDFDDFDVFLLFPVLLLCLKNNLLSCACSSSTQPT